MSNLMRQTPRPFAAARSKFVCGIYGAFCIATGALQAQPVAASELWAASNNVVDIEIDHFDAVGHLQGGLYLKDSVGNFISPLGFAGFAFDQTDNLWAASLNAVDVEFDRFDAMGHLQGGLYLKDSVGNFISPLGFAGFAFSQAAIAPVPEPQSWGMLMAGLILIGSMARKRRPK